MQDCSSRKAARWLVGLCAVTVLVATGIKEADAQALPAPPRESPLREQCIAEMVGFDDASGQRVPGDARILAACKDHYSADYHQQDAAMATMNKRHVVLAYGALWGLVVAFVVGAWLRLRTVRRDIDDLEAQLRQAVAD